MKSIYKILVYFPLLFFGCYLALYLNWILQVKAAPNEFDEAGTLGLEWLISLTIYLWIASIFLGIISWIILFVRNFYFNERESSKMVIFNVMTVAIVLLMYIFNIGYSLTWLFG